MYSKLNKGYILILFGILSFVHIGEAQISKFQDADTLKYSDVIKNVLQNNSLLKQAGEQIKLSELSIKLAQSAYLPVIEINGSYSRMAPIPSFDIPVFGHIQLYPNNDIGFSLDAKQMIYDFGKTAKSIDVQQLNKEIAETSVEQLKQKLVLSAVDLFYFLIYIQEAEEIIEEHLATLEKHLELIENKQHTGSATSYEILSTKVRVSTAETQLADLQSTFEIQASHLNYLMGTNSNNYILENDTANFNIEWQIDSSYSFALNHRQDMIMAHKKELFTEINYQLTKTQNYPSLALFASGGWKNGYQPEIENLNPNYVVGISFYIPVFDAKRLHIKLKMADCSINESKYSLENASREVYDEITTCYSEIHFLIKKIKQSEIQLKQAQEAYNIAEYNFKEGLITNLDLIDAANMLSDSKLLLFKNKIDHKLSLLKLKSALGERIN